MSVTIGRVWVDKNKIVYLCTSEGSPLGGTGTIPATGAVTPDLVTDAAYNGYGEAGSAALRRCVGSGLSGGNGIIAAGAFTQAFARALLMCDAGALNASTIGGINTARARLNLVPRSGTAAWLVDVDIDGANIPEINVTASVAAGTCYLHVTLDHSLAA